jgi:peroxiredoxin
LYEIEAVGASVVAISPELPQHAGRTADPSGVTFDVLSDYRNTVARAFGLVCQFPPALVQLYRDGFKNDLTLRNGTDAYELPVPGTFLISRDGTIRLTFVEPDFAKRLEPADIVRALRAISSEG